MITLKTRVIVLDLVIYQKKNLLPVYVLLLVNSYSHYFMKLNLAPNLPLQYANMTTIISDHG